MPLSSQFQPTVCYDKTATITSGQTVSAAVDLEGASLLGLQLPSTFDGTTLSFQVSTDNTTFVALEDGTGSTLAYTVSGASKAFSVSPQVFAAWRYIKVVAGTSQSTTDTVITLALKPL